MHWALVDGGILKGGELQRNKWMLARGWELGVFSGELRASSSGVKNGKGEDGRGDGTVQKPLRVCALTLQMGLPRWHNGKDSAWQCRRCRRPRFGPCVGKIPCRRPWQPPPVSCLENPMDRGAWCATVHGVTKSCT